MAIGIGLLGLGTVGAGVAALLASPEGRHPLVGQLALRRVAVRDPGRAEARERPFPRTIAIRAGPTQRSRTGSRDRVIA